MWQTLVYIPEKLGEIPLFGFGLLAAIWLLFSLALLTLQIRRDGWSADVAGTLVTLVVLGALICFVLPNVMVEIPDARAAERGPVRGLPIRGYGTMLLAAVAAALVLAMRRARQRGLDPSMIINLAFWLILPGILGARLFHVIEYWPVHYGPVLQREGFMAAMAAAMNISAGGLVVYGSLIGGMLGGMVFIAKNRLPLRATLDVIAPSLALGLALGRVGCFLNGCCFGGLCDLPWAVQFPPESPAYQHQLEQGELYIAGIKLGQDVASPHRLPVIQSVRAGSPAEKAGLRPGVHVTTINGRAVTEGNAEAEHHVLAFGCPGCSSGSCSANKTGLPDSVRSGVQLLLQAVSQAARNGVPVEIVLGTREGHVFHWTDPTPLPPRGEPVHPTQLYSALNALILLGVLLAFEPFQKHEGEVFALLLTLYPISRFTIEIIRDDEPGAYCGLTISQVVSLVLLLAAVAMWCYLRWWGRPTARTNSIALQQAQ